MSNIGRFAAGSGADPIETLTGNSGGPVGPNASGNINVIGANLIDVAGNAGTNTETITLNNGTNGQVIIGGGAIPIWANITSLGGTITITVGANSLNLEAAAAGGNNVKITKFTTNGVFTKDANSKFITLYGWDGGSGGGSGARGADYGGGGGGVSGNCWVYSAPSDQFGANETVTIGTGGAGGAAVVVNDTPGNNGTLGGTTRIGNIFCFDSRNNANGGLNFGGGTGGSATVFYNYQYNYQNANFSTGGNGGYLANGSTATVLNPSDTTLFLGAQSGGGGGGCDAGNIWIGGDGGSQCSWNTTSTITNVWAAGGAGGIESGTIDGGNGANMPSTGGRYMGGAGGGGGGGQSAGLVAGNGGNGGFPAGGGGGGGASLNGTDSGAGGNGADGYLIVVELI